MVIVLKDSFLGRYPFERPDEQRTHGRASKLPNEETFFEVQNGRTAPKLGASSIQRESATQIYAELFRLSGRV